MRTRNTVLFRLHMGPTMMLQQAWKNSVACFVKKGRRAKSGPDSQFGASGDCEGEGKAFHSVSVCPKAKQSNQNIIC